MTDHPPAFDDEPLFDDEPPSDLDAPGRGGGRGGFGGGGGPGGGGRGDGRGGGGGGRVPPHNLDAERALLGALLLSRDAVAVAAELIPGADVFYRPAHAHIYEAVTVLTARGEVADPITVADELRRRDLLDTVGGTAALVDLQADAPGTANAGHYARIVKDHSLLRRLIGAAGSISERAYGMPEDVRKAVDEAESLVFDIARHEGEGTTAQLTDLLGATMDRIEELHDRGSEIIGTPTGFPDLDEITSGLQAGALVVLGARPAMGKTALALGMATNAAMKAQKPVLLFSLEMSKLELVQRILCSEARVDSKKIRNGRLSDADWNGIARAMGRLGDAPIWIDDNPNVSIMEIRSKARRLRSEMGDLGMVVVDYIQLMTGRASAESRQVEVAEISRGLKLLARELECPVVALAQLNRGLEQRADKRPMLSDLRESGSLEQDADIVMFLYRDEVYEATPENQGLAELIIAKQRNGPTGRVMLTFLGHHTRFESMPKDV